MTHQISLSPRLHSLAQWVATGSLLADVGTDHGYLPLWLLQNQRISSAIATDLNQGPLDRARMISSQVGLPLDLRLCDGLQGVSLDEVDTVTIAGMGGMTIAHILSQWLTPHSATPWSGSFLLQPMSTHSELRRCLFSLQLTIERELTICEGKKLYTLLYVRFHSTAPSHYSTIEYLVGKHHENAPDPNRGILLESHLEKTALALANLPSHQTQRKEELVIQKDALSRLLQEYHSAT